MDRGDYSTEVFFLLCALKITFPDHVTMLRGNHETRRCTEYFNFFTECFQKYGAIRGDVERGGGACGEFICVVLKLTGCYKKQCCCGKVCVCVCMVSFFSVDGCSGEGFSLPRLTAPTLPFCVKVRLCNVGRVYDHI